jgi:putative membrane protein
MRRIMWAIGLLASTCVAHADPAPAPTQDFIDKVAVANKFEIDTSELALKYGKNAEVKSFAQQMIGDHTQLGRDFKTSLTEAKFDPPKDSLDVTHTAKYAKLRVFTTESGFDSSYTDTQLEAHKEAVDLFKNYSANGPTGPVKTFAQTALPVLEHHLMMVQALHDKISSPTDATTGSSSGTSGAAGRQMPGASESTKPERGN